MTKLFLQCSKQEFCPVIMLPVCSPFPTYTLALKCAGCSGMSAQPGAVVWDCFPTVAACQLRTNFWKMLHHSLSGNKAVIFPCIRLRFCILQFSACESIRSPSAFVSEHVNVEKLAKCVWSHLMWRHCKLYQYRRDVCECQDLPAPCRDKWTSEVASKRGLGASNPFSHPLHGYTHVHINTHTYT